MRLARMFLNTVRESEKLRRKGQGRPSFKLVRRVPEYCYHWGSILLPRGRCGAEAYGSGIKLVLLYVLCILLGDCFSY